ncbi:MAG: rhodanese-like domain-containing protein [Woeseia sp.]
MKTYDTKKALEHFRARVDFTTGSHELEVLINSKKDPATYQVVDVRYPSDFFAGHVPGAINLPKGKWQNPKGLTKDATLYLYCYNPTCHLAAEAAVELVSQGYKVIEVEGGWDTWVNNGYAIEKPAKLA